MTRASLRPLAMAVAVGLIALSAGVRGQQPAFRTGAEALVVDVNVLDATGTPISDLAASDFDIRVDGQSRKIISAQWVSGAARTVVTRDPSVLIPEGYASNQEAPRQADHLIVIAIDQPNLPPGAMPILQPAINEFIDRVADSNAIAVLGFGIGARPVSFTSDRERLKAAVASMHGQQSPKSFGTSGFYDMGLATALKIVKGDDVALEDMINRDCRNKDQSGHDLCAAEIQNIATELVQSTNQEGQTTEDRLRDLLMGLSAVEAPKTLIVVSQGFFVDDGSSRINALATLAAESRTTVYSMAVEEDALARVRSMIGGVSVADRLERIRSMENLAAGSRGAFLPLSMTGVSAFERVARELTGYYLVGVESTTADRDGRPHALRVSVSRAGTTIRARRSFVQGAASQAARTPRDAVAAALTMPALAFGLPMRGMAVAFRDADPSKVQLLVHAEVGAAYTEPHNLVVGFTVMDRDGRVVGGQLASSNLTPVVAGLPSSLPYVAGANVTPGDYIIRIAAADGDRVGSVEWPMHAALIDLDGAVCTDLVAGGAVLPVNLFQPTAGSQVQTGTLHGYFEAYGAGVGALSATFEVASDERSPALITTDVPAIDVNNDRAIFSKTLVTESLPPGLYTLRAVVRGKEQVLRTLTRAFEVVRRSSPALAAASGVTSATLFLPVAPARIARPFNAAQLLDRPTVQKFHDRAGAAGAAAFDEGVQHFQRGEYPAAAASFKRAVRPEVDATAPLAYLAGVYARQGDDREAANIWRTALLAGSDMPEIYVWLADALIRAKAFGEAQPLLEDATKRWPMDRRFARLLAIIYGMAGRGREATDLLSGAIATNPDDVESLALALEWLYSVNRDGGVLRTRADDLQLARSYAAQYLKIGGPDAALVRRWQSYFEQQKP